MYDPDKKFRNGLCNTEMVELESPSGAEVQELFELVNNHYHATESSRALKLLNDWNKKAQSFVKVMPTDYKRALERIAAEKEVNQTV